MNTTNQPQSIVSGNFKNLRTYSVDTLMESFKPKLIATKKTRIDSEKKSHNRAGPLVGEALELIARKVKRKFPQLWAGNWQNAISQRNGQGYKSQSQADIALAGHIARECMMQGTFDADLFDAVRLVFEQTGLAVREKWTDRTDYRVSTITRAIEGAMSATPPAGNQQAVQLPLDSFGDVRNARAFAHKWRGKLVCVTTRDKWLKWHDQKWQLCEKDEHIAHAKQCCSDILASATAMFSANPETGKRLVADAMAAHNLPKINAMLKLAVSEPEMAVTDRELDSDPMLLGVQNGVVDLHRGHLLFNYPEMRVTRYCNADFVEDAPCPRWIAFLHQIFQEDEETIESVQRLLGYTLTGLVTEEVLVICYGHGSNGKSVFSNVIHNIFGGYAMTSPPSLLTARKADDTSPRNDLAALAGARYVSINELQAGDRLDEQVVKMLAGREPISARFLHREYFEYKPNFTAWLRTNHKPIITGGDDGIWRRLVLLPFRRKFNDDEKDPFLESKLLEERDGILQWTLEGTRKYLKDGLKLSPRIRQENATYRKDSDLIGEFLDDVLEVDPTAKINQQTAYEAWQEWCRGNGFRITSKKSFTQRLAERGYPEGKSGSARFYVGLKKQSKKNLPSPTPTQDGVDRISAVLPNSKNIDSHVGKSVKSEHPVQPAHIDFNALQGEIK
jgi:P4 family phage/plasmid primase-like protien